MSAENAILYYESGQTLVLMAALLNSSGDRKTFVSGDMLWSGAAGKIPVVRPDGVLTGGAVTPAAAGGNDAVDVAALTCNLAGVVTSVAAAANTAVTRPLGDVAKVNSITVDSTGAIAVVAGEDGASSAFSATRGAAGGPPYIPVGSIEIAQVRLTSTAAAAVTAAEIFQVAGTHLERADSPIYSINKTEGQIEFASALPAIHTGDLPKGVYAEYYLPIFAEVPNASDFVAPENSHTVNSEQVYGGTIGSVASSLGQGSYNARLDNGVDDPLLSVQDDTVWHKFYPDRLVTSKYIVCQGKLGIKRGFPVSGSISAACTISAAQKAKNITT